MRALTLNPDQRQTLTEDLDARLPDAVEEFVRWATPVLTFRRTTTREVELHGQTLPAGEKVVLFYHSGNRDEGAFERPWELDITRSPNRHLGFGGGGPHYCLGASLARVQLHAIFGEMMRLIPDIEVGEPELLRSGFIHGIKRMPCTLHRARVTRAVARFQHPAVRREYGSPAGAPARRPTTVSHHRLIGSGLAVMACRRWRCSARSPAAATAATAANLLRNGGAESGAASLHGWDAVTIPGWSVAAGLPTVVRYGDRAFPPGGAGSCSPEARGERRAWSRRWSWRVRTEGGCRPGAPTRSPPSWAAPPPARPASR